MKLHAFAPPKINLTLKIIGRRIDGYHMLESLVTFGASNCGDEVEYYPNLPYGLKISGRFGNELQSDQTNLILKICEIINIEREKYGERAIKFGGFHLVKNLPIASGIGGGTMDAIVALKLLQSRHNFNDQFCLHCAKLLGADGAACWYNVPLIMRGIGDEIQILPEGSLSKLPKYCVLLNPNIYVSTKKVFELYSNLPNNYLYDVSYLKDFSELYTNTSSLSNTISVETLHTIGNDLQHAAIQICPDIEYLLQFFAQNRAFFYAMSGSGGACFGLFYDKTESIYAFQTAPKNWWKLHTELVFP